MKASEAREVSWTKDELESFLSDVVGEKVICDEPYPRMMKTVSLAKFNVMAFAQVYKDVEGKTKAALVPFGAHLVLENDIKGK